MDNKGYVLPWYSTVSIIFSVLILLYLKQDIETPGYWAQNWWPICRLLGGFWAFLWFIDACTNGPTRRSNDRYMRQHPPQ